MGAEALGQILTRVVEPRNLECPADEDTPQAEPCSRCGGRGWVGHRVPLGHPDFGELFPCSCLVDEEWDAVVAATTEAALVEGVKSRNFPEGPPKTFDNFDVSVKGTPQMVDSALRFVRDEGPPVLMLVGHVGSGKSHIAEAIGRASADQGEPVRFEIAAEMLTRLRKTQAPGSEESLNDWLDWYKTRTVLILDDLGSKDAPETAWGQDVLKLIIDHRLNNWRRLVVTTNLSRAEMVKPVGRRIASRLYETNPKLKTVAVVPVTAGDYRA